MDFPRAPHLPGGPWWFVAARCITALCAAAIPALCFAAEAAVAPLLTDAPVYLEVSPEGEDDLASLFDTLEAAMDESLTIDEPVVVVLHGSEALAFTRQGNAAQSPLVDRAARLKAYDLIDLRMCETWMAANGIDKTDLPPFVDTVPYAPEEIRRLLDEGYVPYESVEL